MEERPVNPIATSTPWLMLAFFVMILAKYSFAPSLPLWAVFAPIWMLSAIAAFVLCVLLLAWLISRIDR